MGESSKIEWTDHTFNPWWGCVRVSPGCEHCYAETFDKRVGGHHWGPAATTERRFFGEKHWTEPYKWDAEARKDGVRRKVFCASMADVFEDNPLLEQQRNNLFTLIERTPDLDWLLLTKRPENIVDMMPARWRTADQWQANVWFGTTVESQEYADKRIPELLKVPAALRFLSCEPLLGPVDLREWWHPIDGLAVLTGPQWVITGGESGPGKRFCDPDWMRLLRDQCRAAGVPFFMKQMDKVQAIPDDLLIREFPA